MTGSNRASTAAPLLREGRKGLPRESTYANLSKRELDVLRLLVKGLPNRQIAEELGISVESVRKNVSRALRRTGTKTRTGLVAQALRRTYPIG